MPIFESFMEQVLFKNKILLIFSMNNKTLTFIKTLAFVPPYCHTNHFKSDIETGKFFDSQPLVLIGVLNVASNIHNYGGVVLGAASMRLCLPISL